MNVVEKDLFLNRISPEQCHKRAQIFLDKVVQAKQDKRCSEDLLALLREDQFIQEVRFFLTLLSKPDALSLCFVNISLLSDYLDECHTLSNQEPSALKLSNKDALWKNLDNCLKKCKEEVECRDKKIRFFQWQWNIAACGGYDPQHVEMPPEPSTKQYCYAELKWVKESKQLVNIVAKQKVQPGNTQVLQLLCNQKFMNKVSKMITQLEEASITDMPKYLSDYLYSALKLCFALTVMREAIEKKAAAVSSDQWKKVSVCLQGCKKAWQSVNSNRGAITLPTKDDRSEEESPVSYEDSISIRLR